MNIFIRTDVHMLIGIGHIHRCLKLLSYIDGVHNITFICKKYNNLDSKNKEYIKNIYDKITNKYTLIFIEIDSDNNIVKDDMSTWLGEDYTLDAIKTINKLDNCDILIIDHYAININWELLVKKNVKKLIIIEDFVKRKHNCDYIINGIVNDSSLYKNLVNDNCKLLLGNEYLIIGNQFFNQNIKLREKNRISVFISGCDYTNETSKIIKKLKIINKNKRYNLDIIVGGLNANYQEILELCTEEYFNIHYNIDNIEEIFNKSYISIGALGQSLLERIALKIPSIVFSLSENQLLVSKELIDSGCFKYIGNIPVNYDNLLNEIIYIDKNYDELIDNCDRYFNNNKLHILFKDILL